jgi:hypothetical protein
VACHDVATKVSPFVTNIGQQGYQQSLLNNITLLGVLDLARIEPINLVIFGWLC